MSDNGLYLVYALRRAMAVAVALACLLGGCASMSNTLAQDLAYERWAMCEGKNSTVRIKSVEADGRIWFWYSSPADLAAANECLKRASVDQATVGRPRNVQQIATTAPTTGLPGAAPNALSAPIPTWRPGNEWSYRWESSQGKGTFVWTMDREEVLDGVPFYVIKSGGTRESYFRKSDFAFYMDKLNGEIETRNTPPAAFASWPLTPGAKVELRYTRERPLARATEDMVVTCETSDVETLSVPAGRFDTLKVVCRNSRTNAIISETWLSPAVKQMVRERMYFSYGVRERELIGLKLK